MSDLSTVVPVRPVAPYIGGKRNLARRIIRRINATPHQVYAEAFVGMGGVFLRRDHRPKAEIINDFSEDVSTFFRVLQHHYEPFCDLIRHQVSSRAVFARLIDTDPAMLTDLQRSVRFFYIQRLAFGGKVKGRHFGVEPSRGARFDVNRLKTALDQLHHRLSGVVIERLDWSDFINRYDCAGTLFYLDPPYYGNEADYGPGLFSRDQFERMAEQLAQIRGRFILSLNDRPEVRRIFRAFDIEAARVRYSVGGTANSKEVGEVIISNT